MQTERLPPQNLDAERAVLGAMLLDNGVILKVKEILATADSFYLEAHRKIFSAIASLFEAGRETDLVTLNEELQKRGYIEQVGGASYIAGLLTNVSTSANVEFHARIIKEKSILRALIVAATDIVQMGYDGGELELILGQAQRLMIEVLTQTASKGQLGKLEITDQDLSKFFSVRETPFEALNNALGGFFGGELIVVGSRPGMGKTSLVLEFLIYTAINEQRPVVYFGSGTTRETIYSRILCSLCALDFKDFRRGRVARNDVDKLTKAHKKINEAPIYALAIKEQASAASLVCQARTWAKNLGKTGLIIVENIQELAWPERFRSRKEEVDVILDALQALAIETDTPVILSSQIGRQVDERENKRPEASDLKETGRIEEKATKIFLLFREAYYKKLVPPESPSPEEGELIIAKGGPPMTLRLKFYGDRLSWKE